MQSLRVGIYRLLALFGLAIASVVERACMRRADARYHVRSSCRGHGHSFDRHYRHRRSAGQDQR